MSSCLSVLLVRLFLAVFFRFSNFCGTKFLIQPVSTMSSSVFPSYRSVTPHKKQLRVRWSSLFFACTSTLVGFLAVSALGNFCFCRCRVMLCLMLTAMVHGGIQQLALGKNDDVIGVVVVRVAIFFQKTRTGHMCGCFTKATMNVNCPPFLNKKLLMFHVSLFVILVPLLIFSFC